MSKSIQTIPFPNLALALIPVIVVIFILWKWKIDYKNSIYAIARMLVQLMLIGYILVYFFGTNNSWIVISVLTVMLFSASWIALRTMKIPRKKLYIKCFWSIFLGGGIILLLITQGVLDLQPWYLPSYMIPLAGMIFANAMNSISLAGERLEAEINRDMAYDQARNIALRAALIPIINSLFAVGLVSLPGMMTGQILSGVSAHIAAKYQIMVMCMMFGSSGISSVIFLTLIKSDFEIKSSETGEISIS
jgi:putative ABC transport system permease protein